MNCSEVETTVLESLDRALNDGERESIEQHLAGCPACRAFASTQRTLDASLRAGLRPGTLPPSFSARVLAEVAKLHPPISAPCREERLRRTLAEHQALLACLQHRFDLGLRRGLLDGAGLTALVLGTFLAALPAWPRAEAALGALLPSGVLSPSLAVGCLLALGLSLAAALAARFRISGASLWAP